MVERADTAAYPGASHDARWRKLVYPDDYENPQPKPRYHLIVIGAGPAGLVAAIAAAGLGARVALIERNAMGGDCLNVGCVPSKSLLEHTAAGSADFDAAFDWLRSVRARIAEHDSVERYVAAGVDVFLGAGRFIDDRTVSVGDTTLRGRRILIATGARAAVPPIPGLAECKPLTNESVFDLRARPKRLAVIGAGPIGCELSQAFARLGVEVHLFEAADRVLNKDSPDASRVVAAALEHAGVRLHLNASIERVERRGHNVVVSANGMETTADEVLVSAGRRANTDELNLAAAGVDTDAAGKIVVDRYLRSSNTKVFAAGDVCADLPFTHTADAHARLVVQNALFVTSASARKLIVPYCTYTEPEVAAVGESRGALEKRAQPFDIYRVAFDELDRGKAQGDSDGFVEVLAVPGTGKILGATIVGRDAGEQIAPLCVAMARGIGLGALGTTLLPYPTRAEYLRRLGDVFNRKRLTPRTKRLLEFWFKWNLRP